MNFFKPEDFDSFIKGSYPKGMDERDAIAHFANEKLQREGKVMHGWPLYATEQHSPMIWCDDLNIVTDKPTHRALLINVEEMPKKECEHAVKSGLITYPHPYPGYDHMALAVCYKCGVKLRVKWEAVDE